jgi:ferredoxin
MEAELATRSGQGWRGKHSLVLNREAGSMFFLGEIFLNVALPASEPTSAHCGQCTACIDVCPTQAIVAEGLVDAPLIKVSTAETGWRMVVRRDGKPARTHWRVLDAATRLVEFRPETGRTHQIRVHAARIGCPIAGDPVYGDGIGPMRLHARSLAITLPDGQRLEASCDLPADWPI